MLLVLKQCGIFNYSLYMALSFWNFRHIRNHNKKMFTSFIAAAFIVPYFFLQSKFAYYQKKTCMITKNKVNMSKTETLQKTIAKIPHKAITITIANFYCYCCYSLIYVFCWFDRFESTVDYLRRLPSVFEHTQTPRRTHIQRHIHSQPAAVYACVCT